MEDKAFKYIIRRADSTDLAAITDIYNESVLYSTATADTEPKTPQERMPWFNQHTDVYPLWVADIDGEIIGWGSLSPWSDRCGYRGTVENSVYIFKKYHGKGLGKAFMEKFMEHARQNNFHTIIAKISDDNQISIHLHEKFDFKTVGVLKQTIWKFGKWVDVRLMQWLKLTP